MPHSPNSKSQRRPPSAITAILALSGTLVALLQTLVVPLLPDFPRILHVTSDDASWLVTVTLLSSAVATPIISRSADMYGKRKMMVMCLAIMVAGSVMAAAGGSFMWLIIGRALQGFSAALIPVGMSIMRDELPKEKLGAAVALMSATLGIGGAMGLPLAGVLYESLGWASIFWLSAAAGVLLMLAVLLVVPESTVRAPATFDYSGALLLSAALAALLLAISKGGSWGWGSEPVLLLLLAAAILLAAWVPYELKVTQPMVDLRTSVRRPVLLTNLATLLLGLAMFANMLLTTQQLQLPAATGYGLGLSVSAAGLCMVPSGLAMVVFAPLSGRLIRTFGGKGALMTGASVMVIGYVVRVFLYDSVALVIIGSTVVGIGTAVAYAAAPALIMSAVPITETASANGLNSLIRAIGSSTSSAIIGAVLASVTLMVGSSQLPSLEAFKTVFWMAAIASAAAALTAIFIPRTDTGPSALASDTDRPEFVLQGRILTADNRPVAPAVLTVLETSGEQVDWSHVDAQGNYSVALPRIGEYLMVANAAGWAPLAEVFEFRPETAHRNFTLRTRLEITGTVSDARGGMAGAVVTLLETNGGYVGTTHTGDDGKYAFQLPAVGRYLVAVLHPASRLAMAQKLAVDNRSMRLDFTTPHMRELAGKQV